MVRSMAPFCGMICGSPAVEERAEQWILQLLGNDRKIPKMTAGDLAEPFEVPGMKTEVEGGPSLGTMSRHRIKPLRGDDLVQYLL